MELVIDVAYRPTSDTTIVGLEVDDSAAITTAPEYDAFGNVVRTTQSGGSLSTYTRAQYDDLGRRVAELAAVAASVETEWSAEANSFVRTSNGEPVPTKLLHYDDQGDADNATGYQQILQETTKNADGSIAKRVVYTISLDQISQTTFTGPTAGETLFFHTDGLASGQCAQGVRRRAATESARDRFDHASTPAASRC